MKLTRQQIELIRANTPDGLKGRQVRIDDILGRFQKGGANWSYLAGFATVDGARVLVVTMFGEVV